MHGPLNVKFSDTVILITEHKFVWLFSKANYFLKLMNLPGIILIALNNSKYHVFTMT